MIGDLTSPEALARLGTTTLSPSHGELIIAFSPELFASGRSEDPIERAETLFGAITDQGARLPSQRRFLARAKSETDGISLSAAELQQLDHLLEQGLDAV
jgi:LDH2 family malate/lactate/ureidoglycolate dehydrogenase